MINHSLRVFHKLTLWLALSIASLCAFSVAAHELSPTVADFSVADGAITFDLRLNAEAFLTNIDLDAVSDTDASLQALEYDALQRGSGNRVETLFSDQVDQFLTGFKLLHGQSEIPLSFIDITTPSESIPDVARQSMAQFRADLPQAAQSVSVSWGQGFGQIVLRQQGVEEPYTGILKGGETSPPIALAGGAALSGWQSFTTYIPVGFDHILPKGLDHILFVLGLFFLSLRMGALLWQVTAFTAAHTVTLALGALGWVVVPGSIVEPIIAVSIVYVGVENIFSNGLNRWRPLVVFGFGLLHGLGFASVLGEFGLPAGQFVPALLGFNIGVELGQLTVIAIAFLLVGLWFGKKPWFKSRIANPASATIALVGAYWVIERVFL